MGAVLVKAVCCSAGEKVGLRGLTNAIPALPRRWRFGICLRIYTCLWYPSKR